MSDEIEKLKWGVRHDFSSPARLIVGHNDSIQADNEPITPEDLDDLGLVEHHTWDDEKHGYIDTGHWASEPKNGDSFWVPNEEAEKLQARAIRARKNGGE